jgi:hypothetical protein
MAIESTMLALGTKAPDFRLPAPASGRTVSLNDFTSAPAPGNVPEYQLTP